MKISLFGQSVASLAVAGLLSQAGNQVRVVVDDASIKLMSIQGVDEEPGLAVLLSTEMAAGRLYCVENRQAAIQESEFIFLGLPASEIKEIQQLIDEIGALTTTDLVVINQSTLPVGTTDTFQKQINKQLAERQANIEVDIVVMPELIGKGTALKEFQSNDRIILGGGSEASRQKLKGLFNSFCFDSFEDKPILWMATTAAEYTKFALNAMLATRVSLINELANSAELFGIDMEEVRQGIGTDRRIGFNYINPGCGFGGVGFSEGLDVLVDTFKQRGADATLLTSTLAANEQQKEILFRKAWRYFNRELAGRQVTVWGVSYKPNTASFENAPSLKLVESLLAQGAKVAIFDPKAGVDFVAHFNHPNLVCCSDMYQALEGSEALFLLTEWPLFRQPDFAKMKSEMAHPALFDGRNIYSPEQLKSEGFFYTGIGRGEVV